MPKLQWSSFFSASHLVAAAIGGVVTALGGLATVAAIPGAVHDIPIEIAKQNKERMALDATPFEVTDSPSASIVRDTADGKRLYHVKLAVSAKNDGDQNLPFSWEIFSVHLMQMGAGRTSAMNGVIFDSPPDPFDGFAPEVPPGGDGSLVWAPVACIEHVDTSNSGVRGFLKRKNCKMTIEGGGMTGVRAPHSTNSNANGILLEAHPGDFVGVSTAFGVNDCADEDGPGCYLSQEIIQLP